MAAVAKTLLKKWSRSSSNFIAPYSILFSSSNVGNFVWSWILKDCIKVQEKNKKLLLCLEFPSSTKREIWHFNVVVVKRRIRNVQKSMMHVQSCGFANRNLLLFCRSRWHRRRRCLSSLQRGFHGGGRCNKVTVWSVIAPPTSPSFLGVSHWMCSRRHRLHYSAISGEKVQIEKKLCNVT